MTNLIKFFINRPLVTNLITAFIFLSGIITMPFLLVENFPNVSFDAVLVTTVYPGASAGDVETQVTNKLEKALDGVSGFKDFRSVSVESFSTIFIELSADLSEKEKRKTIEKIKTNIERVSDLPSDAKESEITEMDFNMPIYYLAVTHPQNDEIKMRKATDILESRIKQVYGVSDVIKYGYRDQEVIVEIDPARARAASITLGQVITAIRTNHLNLPAGDYQGQNKSAWVRAIGEAAQPKDFDLTVIRSNFDGSAVRIGGIGKTKLDYEKLNTIYQLDGKPAVLLSVVRNERGDTIKISKKLKAVIEKFNAEQKDSQIKAVIYNDYSRYVSNRISVLSGNAWMGFILVFAVLILFFDRWTSLMIALGIPVALCITVLMMKFLGVSFNAISLMGFLIVIGMLVDDGVSISENIYRHLEMGKDHLTAALDGLKEVAAPVALSIATTIIAFLPLAFMTGIIGKIVQYAPLIVIIALGASVIEAFFLLPSHIVEIQKRKKNFKEKNFLIAPLREKYTNSLKWVLDRKYWAMLVVGLFFIGSILMAGKAIRFVFVPEDIGEAFYIETEAAPGITLEQNQKYLKEVEKKIYTYPKDTIKHVVTSIGAAGLNNRDDVLKTGKNLGQIIVYLQPGDKRSKKQSELMEEINQFLLKQPHFKKVSVAPEENGPPTGKPIYLQFRGPDFKVMDQKARPIYDYLKTIPGTKELNYSYESQNQELHLKINQTQAARFGLTNQQISAEIRAAFDGFIAATMKVGNETVDIRVKLKTGDIQNLDQILDNVKVDNNRGGLIPLRQLVTVSETTGPSRISHEDTVRIVSIMGGIDIKKTSAAEVLKKVNQKFGDPFKGMPEYEMIIKGELQDTNESMASLGISFMMALVANTFILIGFFNSMLLPFIILATIPLSFIGIIVVFFLHGQPLSFPAIMGIVGLSGVVVNNGIVLVTFIEQLKNEGKTALEAVIEGSVTRLRPIILTSVTTVFGLLPTAYGIGGYDPFVKPLALAMAAGLAFATITTLYVIPSLYMIYQEEERIKKKLKSTIGGLFGGLWQRIRFARS